MSDLADILGQIEWYDNSTLSLIDACNRKAFFAKELPIKRPNKDTGEIEDKKGLKQPVGPGALYGTCWHYARSKLYGLRRGNSRQKCEIEATRALIEMHGKMFPGNEVRDRKHSLERAIDVFQIYCEHYRIEDELFIPVETELASLVRIEYNPKIDRWPFQTFWFVARADGIVDRAGSNDRFIAELKTTSSGIDKEMLKLKMSRQPTGYQWSFNQHESDKYIVGTYADVVAVLVEEHKPEKLFKRDVIRRSEVDLAYWRAETIVKVQKWRDLKQMAEGGDLFDVLTTFARNTNECTTYGICPFYNLCYYNLETADLEGLAANDWNPLRTEVI